MNGKVTVKEEKRSIYKQDDEKLWPQDSDLTVMGLIRRLHVAVKVSAVTTHAANYARGLRKEIIAFAQFSR